MTSEKRSHFTLIEDDPVMPTRHRAKRMMTLDLSLPAPEVSTESEAHAAADDDDFRADIVELEEEEDRSRSDDRDRATGRTVTDSRTLLTLIDGLKQSHAAHNATLREHAAREHRLFEQERECVRVVRAELVDLARALRKAADENKALRREADGRTQIYGTQVTELLRLQDENAQLRAAASRAGVPAGQLPPAVERRPFWPVADDEEDIDALEP